MRVGIIDYGVGNLGSVRRAVAEVQATPILVDSPAGLGMVDRLILPGVGNLGDCAQLLDRGGWTDAIVEEVRERGRPILGVCAGMQLLADFSHESTHGSITKGLGLVSGRVEHLRSLGCLKRLPHVGWNSLERTNSPNPLLEGIPNGTDFYFVHSYAFVPDQNEAVLAVTDYGVSVPAVVGCDHIWGTQFHPEKSSKAGFRLLRNFIEGSAC